MRAPLVHPERPAMVRALVAEAGLEALLVSDLVNLRWLTGFTGSAGVAVLGPDRLTVITDGRYGEQVRAQLAASQVDADVLVGTTQDELLAHLTSVVDASRTGFDAANVSFAQHQRWSTTLRTELVPAAGLVERARRCKTPGEVERIAVAASIATAALDDAVESVRPGVTEVEVRNLLEQRMRDLGADGPSYETIVATGPVNAAMAHHRPTATVIEDGHTVVIDVGALVDGFHSDMTRTFLVGTPADEQRRWYDLVAEAQAAGLAAVRAGVRAAEVDAACRAVFEAAGVLEYYVHGTGHGVGLLIHEDPFLNRTSGHVLAAGDVVTVEPGLYRVGLGGIRIEDLVVVTTDGCHNLTHSPKDSPCLPSPPTT